MSSNQVSVFVLTYNQENFIAQAIESILMQKTNFTYQLVIGEDCSTDTTREICEIYAQQFPDKIKILPALDTNIGLIANYMRTLKECDGKYIAICDGDDYWLDEYKLQKQVDFLESNPDFSIIYTRVRKLYPNGEFKESTVIPQKTSSTFDDLIFDNYIPSVTALFKNIQDNCSEIPDWILNYPYGDWPTYLWTIKNGGKVYFLDEITAVYRMEIGVSSKIRKKVSTIDEINSRITREILKDSSFKSRKEIVKQALIKQKIRLMVRYNRERNYVEAFKLYFCNLKYFFHIYSVSKMYLYSLYKSYR
ncbi:glycosyltransferase [Flavobacterium sp. ARAG 55.4]|uniref:glycosyltransferase n=1 Tax=Flavobacterium sp. ARAG 55.4 TaxID=3451357 RepID=UPI003F470740